MFPRTADATLEIYGIVVSIALELNKALVALKAPSHIRIQRLAYNEKGNLSRLVGMTPTSSILLSA